MSDRLNDYLNRYFAINTKIRHEQTRKIYRLSLKNLGQYLQRPPVLDDLTDDNIAGTMGMLIAEKKAPRTVNERRSRLHAFWNWLARRGYISRFPTTPNMPVPSRIPTAWSKDELKRLIHACQAAPGFIGGNKASDWWLTLHIVAWETAERISALLSAEWSMLSGKWLHLPAEIRKGQKSDAIYELSETTVELIGNLRRDAQIIWYWPQNALYFFKRYKALRDSAGLPTDRNHGFHCMRRSVASHYKLAGGDATALLGHGSAKITEQSYIDPRIVPRPHAMDKLFRLDKGE